MARLTRARLLSLSLSLSLRSCLLGKSRRYYVITIVCSLIFSAFLVLGYKISHDGIYYQNPLLYIVFVFVAVLLFFLLCLFWRLCDYLQKRIKRLHNIHDIKTNLYRHSSIKRFSVTGVSRLKKYQWPLSCLLLLLGWLPILLAAWPGFFCYDAYHAWAFSKAGIIDPNHPILHTLIMMNTIYFGEGIFESYNYGIALYLSLQAALVAVILSGLINFLHKRGLPMFAVVISTVFLAISPIISMLSLCSTKDVMFAAILILYVQFLYILGGNKIISGRIKYILLGSLLIAVLLAFRTNAVFALVISLPLILYYCKGNRKILACCCAAGLIIFAAIQATFSFFLPIQKEMDYSAVIIASLPTQQISRVWNSDDISEAERYEISQALGSEYVAELDKYTEKFADSSRTAFTGILMTNSNKWEFLRLWLDQGMRHPSIYFDAVLANTYEAWYPSSTIDGYNSAAHTGFDYYQTETSVFACYVEEPGVLNSKIPWLYDLLYKISRTNFLQTNPLTAWIISVPFHIWIYILAFARALIVRNRRAILPLTFLLLICVTLLLGPMVLVRYYLFLFYLLPFLLFVLFVDSSENTDVNQDGNGNSLTYKSQPLP
jgi:hypothetical protein